MNEEIEKLLGLVWGGIQIVAFVAFVGWLLSHC